MLLNETNLFEIACLQIMIIGLLQRKCNTISNHVTVIRLPAVFHGNALNNIA